jgi:minor extracellular serine protease Vpr
LCALRRTAAFLTSSAALLLPLPAGAALEPVRRPTTELGTMPRVVAGTPFVPAGHRSGRVRVIVRLAQPPLAAWGGRSLASATRVKLNARSSASRAYLARLDALQRAAVARVKSAIPDARVGERYRVVFDGFSVELPVGRLPRLVALGLRVYPSVRYTLDTNRSPDVIRAAAFSSLHGFHGEGLKIGVVDDGIDPRNPFLSGTGYTFPTTFPRGGRPWVNGKIIVARAFPGPHSGRQGRQAFVPTLSFHGTHVSGIAAGNAGTNAPRGPDHPATSGLSGVAPRAQLGNYRVFNEPTPIGLVANTPEIIAAFESAVQDGMDVINFSGGGAMSDPAEDPLLETVANVARAGVVPVISAGNDREDFGFGTVGSPGVAEESITVAAVSNEHVFASPLHVTAPDAPANLQTIPLAAGFDPPASTRQQTLVDVGTIVGRDGTPVDRKLCGAPGDRLNDPDSSPLPVGSLRGLVALASRGVCTFVSKADRARAAGANGLILVDNRFGEANGIPLELSLPSGMISDLDGARLRAYMSQTGGRTTIRSELNPAEIVTGRSGIVASFSSAAPTNFGHLLKPDVAAPGAQILSSTSPESAGSGTPFVVLDGTSMSAPHVSGAVALLLEAHPQWTPRQVRSALVSTAGPAWGNTERAQEAPVTLEGGGLIDVVRADTPLVFTDPVSVSFGDLNANHGAVRKALGVLVADAGGGAGDWSVDLRPQAASAGTSIAPEPLVSLAPGSETSLSIVVDVSEGAAAGDNFGFIVLRRGDDTRRIPYYFAVTRPGLESLPAKPLPPLASGDTRSGRSAASHYRFPSWPFGPPPDYTSGVGTDEVGAEDLYRTLVEEPLVNFGVAVWDSSPGARIHPWVLGSRDENDVWGQGGIPVNVNAYTPGFKLDVGAAGVTFARPKQYWVSVDSGRDEFSGESLAGRYRLHSWRNDVKPPVVRLLSARVAAGRPLVLARVVDFAARGATSGVDPTSLALGYRGSLVFASAYDRASGLVVFDVTTDAPTIPKGRNNVSIIASDFQEAKNLSTPNGGILPNTTVAHVRLQGVDGPAVAWATPERGRCVSKPRQPLLVAASSTAAVREVRFLDGKRLIARRAGATRGLSTAAWPTAKAKRGAHRLTAVVRDARGREASAAVAVRVCR